MTIEAPPMLTRRQFAGLTAGSAVALSARPAKAAAPAAGVPDARFKDLMGICARVANISDGERADRRDRLQALLAEAGHSALVSEPSPTITYLTGAETRRSERPLLHVLPAKGAAFWIGPAFEEGRLRNSFIGDGELVVWQEHESPYPFVFRQLKKRGLAQKSIALEPSLRFFVAEGLREAGAGAAFPSGGPLIDRLRMKKSAGELAILRAANVATKRALRVVSRLVEPGMAEDEIAELVVAAQTAAGLNSVWALVGVGENAAYPHGSKHRRPLKKGDLVLCDTGGSLCGYQSDITRTWPVGSVPAAHAKAWRAVLAAQDAAFSVIRPGTTCGDVDKAARKVLADRGYGKRYETFTHRLGHGIGLEGHEAPYFVGESPLLLEAGMTLSNEPGLYVPGKFGIRIEDILAVTDNGFEVFGPRAKDLEDPFGE